MSHFSSHDFPRLMDSNHRLTPDDVAGGIYGEVVEVLKRRVANEKADVI